jgi:osmoprotectant transport system ATP-binding protein
MFALDGATKRFGSTVALHPTTLAFAAGETTVLIGQSGCGKSTLLRLLVGLLLPDEGTVTFDGEPLTPASINALRHKMGYVIQEGGLFPHLTASQNVTLLARHLGWDAARVAARVEELAALTHLPPELLKRYPVELSGGQRQRVSLMRALMLDPDVLLLDEPLGALDPMIRSDLQTELRDICRTLGKTVVMVTHDLAEAGFFGHTIVLLRAGRIVQSGSLHTLMHEPVEPFVSEFVRAQRTPLEAIAEAD